MALLAYFSSSRKQRGTGERHGGIYGLAGDMIICKGKRQFGASEYKTLCTLKIETLQQR